MAETFNERNLTIVMNQTGNKTAENITGDVEEFTKQLDVRTNVIVLVTTFAAMLVKLPGCVSLFYSVRVPFNFRYVTLSFMLGILTFDSCMLILQTLTLVFGFRYMILHDLRSVLPNLFVVITWSSLAHLAIDRFFFVTQQDFHQKHITRLKVLAMILFNWFYPIAVVLATVGYIYSDPIYNQNHQLDNELVVMIRVITASCYAFYNGVAVIAYIALRRYIGRLENTVTVNKVKYSSTRFLISITIASSVLQSPHFLMVFVFDVLGFTHPIRGSLRMFTFILIMVSMVLNTFLIISKMKECQYHFTRVFLSCFDKYREKAKALRVSVYGVTSRTASLPRAQ